MGIIPFTRAIYFSKRPPMEATCQVLQRPGALGAAARDASGEALGEVWAQQGSAPTAAAGRGLLHPHGGRALASFRRFHWATCRNRGAGAQNGWLPFWFLFVFRVMHFCLSCQAQCSHGSKYCGWLRNRRMFPLVSTMVLKATHFGFRLKQPALQGTSRPTCGERRILGAGLRTLKSY